MDAPKKEMAKNLFIGNLPYSATEEQLKEFFSQAGNVESARIVMDKFTGRSRGFGFVEYSTEEEAQNAIATLHGKDLAGRAVTVTEARPKAEKPQ